jgi:ubiquitin-conjugating enzyme E2 variant
MTEVIVIPRNFKLLEELENVEKGKTSMEISFGLAEPDDITLSAWQCTILGPMNTPVENRIISLLLHAGPNYPREEPTVIFQTKLNYPFIEPDGKGNFTGNHKIPSPYTIETYLLRIRQLFAKADYRKLKQPPEGQEY